MNDIERVKTIRHAAFAAHAPSAYSPQEVVILLNDLDEHELRAMIDERQLFVAEAEGTIVGCAGWRGENLRHVYVWPEAERAGIGTRLVAHAESDFRNRTAATEISVGSVLYARPFYETLGYEVVGREKAWDGSEFFRMTKRVARES